MEIKINLNIKNNGKGIYCICDKNHKILGFHYRSKNIYSNSIENIKCYLNTLENKFIIEEIIVNEKYSIEDLKSVKEILNNSFKNKQFNLKEIKNHIKDIIKIEEIENQKSLEDVLKEVRDI